MRQLPRFNLGLYRRYSTANNINAGNTEQLDYELTQSL
jgi:hypothetical protein